MNSLVRIGKSASLSSFTCVKRRALGTKMSTPVGNLPSYRTPSGTDPNHNRPWNCITFNSKGPFSVINDAFRLKKFKKGNEKESRGKWKKLSTVERIKLYIILFTDCLARASILDFFDRKFHSSVKKACVRLIIPVENRIWFS